MKSGRAGLRALSLATLLVLGAGFLTAHGQEATPDAATPPQISVPILVLAQESESGPTAGPTKPSDEYGNVTQEEVEAASEKRQASPTLSSHGTGRCITSMTRCTSGCSNLSPAVTSTRCRRDFRGLFSNFYENLKAPIRIVNNMLQGKPGYAGKELVPLLHQLDHRRRRASRLRQRMFWRRRPAGRFGQTPGKYGVGFGFYIVWPILGPSCPRDTVGFVGDWLLRPTTYLSSNFFDPVTIGLYVHQAVNTTSFHLGDYEAIKAAAVDP